MRDPFDEETWAQLPALLAHLPEPVHLVVWGDEVTPPEAEAAQLCRTLAGHFPIITTQMLPRRANYNYWPVIGVMRGGQAAYEDVGARIIGLPHGYQMTSFITAIQAVSFQGMSSEALTRIQLGKLKKEVRVELLTAADNEVGALMAHPLFNMAVVSPYVRVFMIMADQFPLIVQRYSVNYLPHTVINGRVHLEGVADEAAILRHMARAVGRYS